MAGNKKIVVIGGGTGLSTMLKGLKLYTRRLTAVVTVADDGGSSGMLRSGLGMLPPGDIRNCINALADTNPILKELISYRFPADSSLEGHSFGNLMLAALNGVSDSFDEAVIKMNRLCGVDGMVLPVTNEDVRLEALLSDGSVILGESLIGEQGRSGGSIERLRIVPQNPKPVPAVLDAITAADVIVMGPGSLYTSIIPNLLVDGVAKAIMDSHAVKIYVCNIMTQPGETDNYSVSDHLFAIEKHSQKGIIDYVLANNEPIPEELTKKYLEQGAEPVLVDREKLTGVKLDLSKLMWEEGGLVRHDYIALGKRICQIADGEI